MTLAALAVKLHLLTAVLDTSPHPATRAATSATVALLVLLALPLTCMRQPRALRMAMALNCLITSVGLADLVRYRFFGDVLSIAEFQHAWQLVTVGASVLSLLRATDALYYLDVLLLLLVSVVAIRPADEGRQSVRGRRMARVAALLLAAAVLALPSLRLVELDPDEVFEYSATRREVAVALGLLPYHFFDLISHIIYPSIGRLAVTESDRARVRQHFDTMALSRLAGSKLSGAARGRNVILIMSESLQAFPLGLVVDGQHVTPGLSAFSRESLSFANFYDQTHAGTTSDGEFTSLQSLHPLPAGVVSTRYPSNDFHALPAILRSNGYKTLSASAESGDFWNKRQMHPRLGFGRMYFGDSYQAGEVVGIGLADAEFFTQTSRFLTAQPEPFMAFLITLSNHHPYKLPAKHRTLRVGSLENSHVGDYLQSVHYYDQVFSRFIEELRRTGLLDRSLVIVYGDHQAFWRDVPELPGLLSVGEGETFKLWQARKRLPLFVRFPNAEHAGVVQDAAAHLDIAPTVLSLLGLSREGEVLLGRDLTSADVPLVVLRDGSFVNNSYAMIRSGLNVAGGCFDVHSGAPVDCAPLHETEALAREQLRVSDLVIRGNLIPELRRRMVQRRDGAQLTDPNAISRGSH